MSDDFDFLHIKDHTEGSSNELSFDVLEHRRNEAEGKKTRPPKGSTSSGSKSSAKQSAKTNTRPKANISNLPSPAQPSKPRISAPLALPMPRSAQKSLPSATRDTGSSSERSRTQQKQPPVALSRQKEVVQRKEMRRRSRAYGRLIVAVVLLALIGVGAFFGMRFYNERVDNATQIERLIERLSRVDESLVEADQLMIDPLDTSREDEQSAVLKSSPQLTTELNKIAVDAQSIDPSSLDERESVVVSQISEAALGRNAMLEAADETFVLVHEITSIEEEANRVWNGVVGADQLAREAISEANKATTQEATTQSIEKMQQALDQLKDNLIEMEEIESGYPVSFKDYTAFLAKKIEALSWAITTSEALLAGNREEAESANSSYNIVDSEAVKLAEGLPTSIGDVVKDAYKLRIESLQERYDTARTRVIQADSAIREFVAQ